MLAEFRKMDVQNISLRKDLETKEKHVEELNSDVMRSQLEIAEMKTLVSKTEVESANMATKIEVYQSSASEKTKSNEKSDKDVIRGLEDKLEEYKERYDFLMEEKVVLESKCRDLESKLKTTKQNLKKADKENKKLLGERDSLRKESEQLQQEVETLKLTAESLTTQLAELESSIMKSVEDRLTSLQNNLEKEQTGRRQLETDLENLRARHIANEKNLTQLQQKKQEQEQEYKSKLKKKQEELESCKKESELLEKKMEVVTTRFEQASTQEESSREELKMEIDLLQCDLQAANTDLEGEQLLIKDTEALLMTSIAELLGGKNVPAENLGVKALTTAMIDNLKEVQDKMAEKSTELEKALENVQSNTKTIEALEAAAATHKTDQEDLHSKLDAANFDVVDLKEQLSNTHSTQAELDTEIEGLNQRIAEYITEAGVNSDQIKEFELRLSEQEVHLVTANTTRAELESALDGSKQSSADSKALWDKEKEEFNRKVTKLTTGAEKATKEITDLEYKFCEAQSHFECVYTEKENLNTKMEELIAKAGGATEEISALKLRLNEQETQLENANSIKSELESALDNIKKTSSASESEWNTEKENLNKKMEELIAGAGGSCEEISDLKHKISEQESQLESARALQEEQHAEMETLRKTLEERAVEEASLRETLEKQKADFSSIREGLQQEVSALRFELSSQQMEHQQALQVRRHLFIIQIQPYIYSVPTEQGKRKMAKNILCQGKHREFGNFDKTQGKHGEFGLLKM